jgi:hypothetical protein
VNAAAVLDLCPPVVITDAWLAALRYLATGCTAQDVRERALEDFTAAGDRMTVIADRMDQLAAEGLTPVQCWHLGGLDQLLGPYPVTPEAGPASGALARRVLPGEVPAPVAAALPPALLWLASQPWYQALPWLSRAVDAYILLVAVTLAVLVVSFASQGLERLALSVPRLLRARRESR